MQNKRKSTPMAALRRQLRKASLSYNKEGDEVRQAILSRELEGQREHFVVAVRKQHVAYFQMRWNPGLRNSTGDWESVNALVVESLDELYHVANDEQRRILESPLWLAL